jgi:pyruvate/2-oxoglutarate dehydrogenase complex dihydrolipoamide dehydrogenase (E3) component
VDVFIGDGRFTGPTTLAVEGTVLEFSRAVVATGARAVAPPIPGLEHAGYRTNESVFALTALPPRLVVIGAGPIGCELAQAFRCFGAEVTLIETAGRILLREDADAAGILQRRMQHDGVRLVCEAKVTGVERQGAASTVRYEVAGAPHETACDEILIGVGRAPNVEGLGLDAAGIAYGGAGVTVNDYLQTSNPRVYGAGDVASPYKFTHTADALARIALQNALFAGRKRVSALHVPWCTYTTPEIAHVGLYESEAQARGIDMTTITVDLGDVDRAILDGEDEGFVRVHLAKGSDRILGATIVAAHAGDMISEISVAMVGRRGLGTIASTIHPYPTQAEAIRKAGDAYNRTRLTPFVRKVLDRWFAFRR